ncbi:MAG: hypothetical protein WCI51_09455 [Lentisphaerota bacterium]
MFGSVINQWLSASKLPCSIAIDGKTIRAPLNNADQKTMAVSIVSRDASPIL